MGRIRIVTDPIKHSLGVNGFHLKVLIAVLSFYVMTGEVAERLKALPC